MALKSVQKRAINITFICTTPRHISNYIGGGMFEESAHHRARTGHGHYRLWTPKPSLIFCNETNRPSPGHLLSGVGQNS